MDSDNEAREVDEQNRERLKIADDITKVMTKEQYMDYSECRQASFTYKKAKKFRDWVESPMNDEVAEVLGYLSWEAVGLVTQTALEVKQAAEHAEYVAAKAKGETLGVERSGHTSSTSQLPSPAILAMTDARWLPDATTTSGGLCTGKLLLGRTVVPPAERGPPIQKSHVLEASRRLKPLEHSVSDSVRIPNKHPL